MALTMAFWEQCLKWTNRFHAFSWDFYHNVVYRIRRLLSQKIFRGLPRLMSTIFPSLRGEWNHRLVVLIKFDINILLVRFGWTRHGKQVLDKTWRTRFSFRQQDLKKSYIFSLTFYWIIVVLRRTLQEVAAIWGDIISFCFDELQ